jgi:hypothetical protein
LTTWSPERFLDDTAHAANVEGVNDHYLIMVEQLVRAGRSEEEIDRIVAEAVDADGDVLEDELDDLRTAA